MPERSELGRQLPLRGPLKALEADIHHANTISLAPFFLYLIQWLDCGCCYALPSYLGLFHILICKVYADGDSSVSTYERRASLREFYAIIYPILQQLEGSLIERDLKGKGRCKDMVSRKRLEDWRKLCNKDVEREDECGICMETCTKMVLPNCSHAMCIKCYRDCLKRIRSRDLWVLTNYNDVVDPVTLERENVRHFYSYIDSLPLILPDNIFFYYDYLL
uniref:RING-type domain-containing protein n=1 Tax=Oryza barthii TaxID=65489 RepID=A0A0D3GPJ4_9ORYZ